MSDRVTVPVSSPLGPSAELRDLTRLLMTTAADGRSVAVGRDEHGDLWAYRVDRGVAGGRVAGPASLLPYPPADEGELRPLSYVIAGLTAPEDSTVNVFIENGYDTQQCRVHAHVWVSPPQELRPGISPSLSWRDAEGMERRRFKLPPLTADMLEPSAASYAPLAE